MLRGEGRATAVGRTGLPAKIQYLYEGEGPQPRRFRAALLTFDLATVVFIIASSFMPRSTALELTDIAIGLVILLDFSARAILNRNRPREYLRLGTLADIAAIVSFLAPIAGEGAGFLRVLRTLRLLYTFQVLERLRRRYRFVQRNEEVLIAALNLAVFVFVMTGIVYETQHWRNPLIGNYADALYFTVTALTTTGFGDITLPGTAGRLISVVIMIFGVTLFLRLAQVLFRPHKVRFPCPTCGLQRHESDAVHCKACGTILAIPDEGAH